MARRDTYVTTAALLAVLAGASWVSYAVAQGEAAYGIEVSSVDTTPTEPPLSRTVVDGTALGDDQRFSYGFAGSVTLLTDPASSTGGHAACEPSEPLGCQVPVTVIQVSVGGASAPRISTL